LLANWVIIGGFSYDSANFVTDLILSVLNQQRTVPDFMPIYEYQCKECGHNLEVIQRFSDAPLSECPACHQCRTFSKLVSAPSFSLKGGGWYETDFKTANKRHGTQDADGDPKNQMLSWLIHWACQKNQISVSSTAPAATGIQASVSVRSLRQGRKSGNTLKTRNRLQETVCAAIIAEN
jgi:putative FmdB family regulatory protein